MHENRREEGENGGRRSKTIWQQTRKYEPCISVFGSAWFSWFYFHSRFYFFHFFITKEKNWQRVTTIQLLLLFFYVSLVFSVLICTSPSIRASLLMLMDNLCLLKGFALEEQPAGITKSQQLLTSMETV